MGDFNWLYSLMYNLSTKCLQWQILFVMCYGKWKKEILSKSAEFSGSWKLPEARWFVGILGTWVNHCDQCDKNTNRHHKGGWKEERQALALHRRWYLGWVPRSSGNLAPVWEAQATPSCNTLLCTWPTNIGPFSSRTSWKASPPESADPEWPGFPVNSGSSAPHQHSSFPQPWCTGLPALRHLPEGRGIHHYPSHSLLVHVLPTVTAEDVFIERVTTFRVSSPLPWFDENRSGSSLFKMFPLSFCGSDSK